MDAATTVTGAGTGSTTANSIVTNVGTAGSRFEPDVQLKGDVWSASTLTLKDRVHVFGVTHATAAPVRGANVLTDGGVDTTTPFTPSTTLQWTVALPASGPAMSVSPGQSTSRGPGAYGNVQVFQNATLTLSTGTYYFDALQLESGAHVVLNQTSGPVVIYVRTTLILRGDIKASTSGAAPDLLLVYLGTASASAEVPFSGTLLAPNSRLFLGSVTPGHTGAFFAKNLEVGAHTKVTFRAPHVLLIAGRVPGGDCLDAIVADSDADREGPRSPVPGGRAALLHRRRDGAVRASGHGPDERRLLHQRGPVGGRVGLAGRVPGRRPGSPPQDERSSGATRPWPAPSRRGTPTGTLSRTDRTSVRPRPI